MPRGWSLARKWYLTPFFGHRTFARKWYLTPFLR